jgi:hypothetical protein
LLWAWLCSLALRDAYTWLVTSLRNEFASYPLPICLARLLLLPLSILRNTALDITSGVLPRLGSGQQGGPGEDEFPSTRLFTWLTGSTIALAVWRVVVVGLDLALC